MSAVIVVSADTANAFEAIINSELSTLDGRDFVLDDIDLRFVEGKYHGFIFYRDISEEVTDDYMSEIDG